MTASAFSTRRFRTMLDGALLLLLVLASLSHERLTQAKIAPQPLPGDASAVEQASLPSSSASFAFFSRHPASQAPARSSPPAGPAPQDNNLLAALIAAENAALTVFSNISSYLPVVIH